MQKTGDAASARSEEMLSTRLETGENCRTVKHNQRKGHCPAVIKSLASRLGASDSRTGGDRCH